ncbi:MAG: YceI family protein [Sphingobacteriales bacterium]|nr:MAG: YceI family protein [Sphingobacteriales bacterium]
MTAYRASFFYHIRLILFMHSLKPVFMKRLLIAIAPCILLFSCTDAPKADKAEATEAQAVAQPAGTDYKADLQQSVVEWVGTKPTKRHHGTFKLSEGSLASADGALTGGKFVIDMNSLTPDDQDAEGNTKLQGHLKGEDFFDAAKFPASSFEITAVKQGVDDKNTLMKDATHTITGNLTMKTVTKSISFPAKVAMSDAQLTADAEFNIDRTQWNITYGSDKSLGDKFISPDVNIKLHLVANK